MHDEGFPWACGVAPERGQESVTYYAAGHKPASAVGRPYSPDVPPLLAAESIQRSGSNITN